MITKAVKQSSFLRFIYNKETTEKLIKPICTILGIEKDDAHIFLSNLYLTSSKTQHKAFNEQFEIKLKILVEHLTPSQIINNPKIFTNSKPETLTKTIQDFQSFGVNKIGIEHLSNPKLIWQLNEREWKNYSLIDDSIDCAVSYIASQTCLTDLSKQAVYDRMCEEVPDYKLMPIYKLKALINSYIYFYKSQ